VVGACDLDEQDACLGGNVGITSSDGDLGLTNGRDIDHLGVRSGIPVSV